MHFRALLPLRFIAESQPPFCFRAAAIFELQNSLRCRSIPAGTAPICAASLQKLEAPSYAPFWAFFYCRIRWAPFTAPGESRLGVQLHRLQATPPQMKRYIYILLS
ncbi:hypothetical protein NDU88_001405 [Pleurodeles waltl]|uniref:Uncharacterized protein n=1 Tax=Pleurodeles waltl TaxID=8319 RepID=A0AAV7RA87_PLEWA|nr:hypothetical protein NDU88_001405 [Pleurodeles waltl]